jgi:alpha/beta superfamily hydrolase
LNELLQHPESNVLVVHGNQDEFTSQARYKEWASELRGNVEVVEIDNAAHFWQGRSGQQLVAAVKKWLP